MQELKLLLAQEQPHINTVLDRHVDQLPAASRPIARHVLLAGGKRLRPLLTLLTGRALGFDGEGLYDLGAAIELLHAATLLHDDILDNAHLRRGRPAAHTVFPPTTVVLAGDAMLAKAMLMVSAFGDTRLTDCISEAVMRTAEGEITEFTFLRNPDLSQEAYLEIITGKTAWMLRASCELGALKAGADERSVRAAAAFGLELGIAFQIVDDALDYAPATDTGKPTGGDLKEGKVTPPLLFYLQSLDAEEAADFKRRFAADSLNPEELARTTAAIYDLGFADRARGMAGARLETAARLLHELPVSPERRALEQMVAYVLQRDH